MSRPAKNRTVGKMPEHTHFMAADSYGTNKGKIIMNVEEYEAFRLIDGEGMTQDQCAEQMVVSRTTVQRIYKSARAKIAKMLINGSELKIEGGSYCINENI